MRVMIDSNILISLMISPEGRVSTMMKALVREYTLCIPSYCLLEMEDVVRRKWPHQFAQLGTLLQRLSYEIIPTPSVLTGTPYIRDHNDRPILATAISGDVDVLLTGDKDFADVLLVRPKIMTPAQFAAEYL